MNKLDNLRQKYGHKLGDLIFLLDNYSDIMTGKIDSFEIRKQIDPYLRDNNDFKMEHVRR